MQHIITPKSKVLPSHCWWQNSFTNEELDHLGIFLDDIDTIKIIEWPDLIKTPLEEKLEIYLEYGKSENERKMKIAGFGKWKNFNNEF